MSVVCLIYTCSSLIVVLSRSRHELSLRHTSLTGAHDFTSLHELAWNICLNILRSTWFLILSVLEGSLIRLGNHRLMLDLLRLITGFSSVWNWFLLVFVASRALHLFSLPRLTSSIVAVIQMLGVDCLRCIGWTTQDKSTTITLPWEPLDLPFYCFMNKVLAVARSFLLLIRRLASGWRTLLIIMLLWKILLIVLVDWCVAIDGLWSLLILVWECHSHVATHRVPSRMELPSHPSTIQDCRLVQLLTAIVDHGEVPVTFCSDRNLSFFHIWVSTNSSWFLSATVLDLILNSIEWFIVRVSLINVRLHHRILLLNDSLSWESNTFIAFLTRLTNSLESRVLMLSNSYVRLKRIHRLRSSHHIILSVSHLLLGSSKLWTLWHLVLLLGFDLEAIWRLKILRLSLRSVRHRRACSVSRNLSLILIGKYWLLSVRTFMWLSISLTDHLSIHGLLVFKLELLDVSPWLWTWSCVATA